MTVSNQVPAAPTPDAASGRQTPALDGQIAVVTGGAAGIGAAICRALSRAGAVVVIADLNEEGGRATAASTANPEKTFVHAVDVSDPDQVHGLIDGAVTRLGRIDLLVNNAGVIAVAPLETGSLAVWRRTFAVNVEGPLLTMSAVAPIMLRQAPLERTGCRGKIVNISSPAAEHGRPPVPAYGASKAALNHLSKSAAASWGERGIATTIVYPGNVEDAMWPRVATDLAAVEGRPASEIIQERLAGTLSGRFQKPAEVAEAVLFVAAFRGLGMNGRIVWSEPHVSQA